MSLRKIFFAVIGMIGLIVGWSGIQPALAAGKCFCYTPDSASPPAACENPILKKPTDLCNPEDFRKNDKNKFVICEGPIEEALCGKKIVAWKSDLETRQKAAAQKSSGLSTGSGDGFFYSAIHGCATEDKLDFKTDSTGQKSVAGPCGDVSIFVTVLIQLSKNVFGVIGGLALLAFVYGGFMLILSEGNPERVKKGTDAMMAAAIGLAIAFGGYALVKIIGDSLGLAGPFKLQ